MRVFHNMSCRYPSREKFTVRYFKFSFDFDFDFFERDYYYYRIFDIMSEDAMANVAGLLFVHDEKAI